MICAEEGAANFNDPCASAGRRLASIAYYADGTRAEKIAPGNLTSQFYYMGGLGYLDAGDSEFAANQEIAEYDGATLLRRYTKLPLHRPDA